MTIQFNTDKNLKSNEAHQAYFSSQIKEALERFDDHITRVEVHLKDVNGKKAGVNDKSCVLETRMKGQQPTAVTNHANDMRSAVTGALSKMKTLLESKIGRLQTH